MPFTQRNTDRALREAVTATRRTHEAVRLEVGDRAADIDVALVGVIGAAWRLGISTEFSCQGRVTRGAAQPEPWGYISFGDVEDLRRFLACFDGTDLAERRYSTPKHQDPVTGLWTPVHRRRWSVSASVPPLADDEEPGTAALRLRGRVGFPTADIGRMQAVLEETQRAIANRPATEETR